MAGQEEDAKIRLQKDVDFWVCDNKRHLNDEAIAKLRGMTFADQRRVIGGGPLEMWKDLGQLFRTRASAGRERERELAERKGVDASKFAREPSAEEQRSWLETNKSYIDDVALREFESLDPEDRWRVIQEGPLRDCVDPAYAIQQRAKQSSQLASEVAVIFAMKRDQQQARQEQAAAAPAAPVVAPHVAAQMQQVFNSYVGPEVPAHQRRCGGFGKANEPEKPPLVGSTKGVGGVIEALKQKYGLSKGQRLKVVGENGGPAGIWLLEGDKSVPKTHWKEGGWKWVLELEPPAPAAPAKAPKAEPKKDAEPKKAEPEKQSSEEEGSSEAKPAHRKSKGKRKDKSSSEEESDHRKRKGKRKSACSGSSSEASPPKKAPRKKEGRKRKDAKKAERKRKRSSSEEDASDRQASESSDASSRGRRKSSRGRKKSSHGQRRRK